MHEGNEVDVFTYVDAHGKQYVCFALAEEKPEEA